MTVNISNTLTTNTFEYWRNRTNELAVASRQYNVTVNSNTAIGNASVSATLSGGVLLANNTTTSTSNATGALIVKGGAGIAENLNVGGTFDLDGIATFNNTANFGEAAFTANVTFGDGDVLSFGADADLELSHDGVDSVIKNGSGLKIDSDLLTLRNGSQSETMATFAANGAVTLYHDNAAKFATSATGVDVTGTATVDSLTIDGTSDINGTMTFQSPADVSFDDIGANGGQYVRVNAGGTALEYSNVSVSQLDEIADVVLDYGSLANAHVIVYDADTNAWVNRSRSLIDLTQISDLDNVNAATTGQLLVKVTGGTFSGTSNGFVAGKLNNFSEQVFTSQTGNTLAFTSTSDSVIEVYVNGLKLAGGGEDYSTNTTSINMLSNFDALDYIQVTKWDPDAFTVTDGTVTDSAHSSY